MSPDQLRRAISIFSEAVDLDGHARARRLDELCQADHSLRGLVEEMLACDQHGSAETLLANLDPAPEASLPLRIGRYEIVRLIGEGGMGFVYEARQDAPSRSVALKVLRSAFPTRELVARFRREADVLGTLHHPGIAAVYEAGMAAVLTADGPGAAQPFLAMELVHGPLITHWCAGRALSDCVELVAAVCDAVEHAHRHGVVHRDLKPANILVDNASGKPQPKVLDFGVARVLNPGSPPHTLQTEPGRILGTLPYMSPEQVAGSVIDRPSDIYALGTILYEVLAGRPPLHLRSISLAEAARIIREEEPSRLASLNAACRGDLQTIVAKAMAKDPSRRYAAAADMAADLRRYLRDEPIAARPPGAAYQFGKFAKRNKVLVGGAGAVFLVLVLGVTGTTTFALRERRRAQETNRVVDLQSEMLSGIVVPLLGAQLHADIMAQAAEDWRRSGLSESAIEARTRELEALLAGVNFTTTAVRSLESSIFDRTLTSIDESFADEPLLRARLLQRVADTMRVLGLFDRAMAPQTEALNIRRRDLPADHPDTLASTAAMAVLLGARFEFQEAEPYAREALDGLRRVLGRDHPDTLAASLQLGYVLMRLARLAEAEGYVREAADGRRRVFGADHPDTLTATRRLGQMLLAAKRMDEAEPVARATLDASRRVLGDDHEQTLLATVLLANLLQQQGNHAESEPLWRCAAERYPRVKGDDYRDTLFARAGLGKLLMERGRLDEAEPYLADFAARSIRVLGERHPDTLLAMRTVSELRRRQERLAEAESLSREALERHRSVLGPEHPDTSVCAGQLASILDQSGRPGEAAQVRGLYMSQPPTGSPAASGR